MKKYLTYTLTFCLITIFSNNIVLGDCNQCLIKDGPPDALNHYLTNLKKVRENLSKKISQISNDTSKLDKDINNTSNKLTGTFNSMIDWGGYYSLFDFYVTYSVNNDYVPEIRRDYNLLETESKGMNQYLKYITSKGIDNIELSQEDVCGGIENCNFSGNIIDVIGSIIKNHEAMKNYYRLSILGKKNDFHETLQMVDTNFMTDFGEYYNESTTNHCGQCENGGFTKIKQQIDDISSGQISAKNGIQTWQDAISLLQGNSDNVEYARRERELLQKQLSRDGTSGQASQNALKNLEKYNQGGGFSLNNNFITNSFEYIKNTIGTQLHAFSETILQQFKGKSEIPTSNFNKNNTDLKITQSIEERTNELYQTELPFAQLEDTSNDDLQGEIIELHYNLAQSINSLNISKDTAEKICDKQGTGMGNCTTK